MKLSALRGDFVLLAPAFGSGTHWSLFRPGPGDSVVWLAKYEAPEPMQFRGSVEEIELDIDVTAPTLRATLDEAGFVNDVGVIREAIAAGDVYQVNLTRRATLVTASDAPAFSNAADHAQPEQSRWANGAQILAALCRRGVPRFAAWLKLAHIGEFVSASPELLFALDGRHLRAEPMKGTAPVEQRAWLEGSAKDKAELAMITDLLRDDLNHLCVPRSVRVPSARRFIELPYVVQAVSDVECTLRDDVTVLDVMKQLHPGGSITGAPRLAARELIAKLERGPRGFYCGFLGLQQGQRTRAAILIRTAQREAAGWRYDVGSGITWPSVAEDELRETRLKLGAL